MNKKLFLMPLCEVPVLVADGLPETLFKESCMENRFEIAADRILGLIIIPFSSTSQK